MGEKYVADFDKNGQIVGWELRGFVHKMLSPYHKRGAKIGVKHINIEEHYGWQLYADTEDGRIPAAEFVMRTPGKFAEDFLERDGIITDTVLKIKGEKFNDDCNISTRRIFGTACVDDRTTRTSLRMHDDAN